MKKGRIFVKTFGCATLASLMFMFASCVMENNEETNKTKGKGVLSVSLSIGADFESSTNTKQSTKALVEDDYRDEKNYTVQIFDSNNDQVGSDYSFADMPETIELEKGNYTVKAFYGKEHNASRNEFYVEGTKTISVNGGGELTTSQLSCEPTCGKVVTNFSDDMSNYFDAYSVEYSTTALNGSTVKWSEDDNEPYYLLLPKEGETITASIKLTPKSEFVLGDQAVVTRTYKLLRNKSWTLNIKPSYTGINPTLGIVITFDDSTEDKDVEIIIPSDWLLD
jgi:hypothetical protein